MEIATAGNDTYSKESGEAVGDICPAGWSLPIGSQTNADGSFSRLDTTMGGTGGYQKISKAYNKWFSFSNTFINSGYKDGFGAFYSLGQTAHYWSSLAINEGNAYYLNTDKLL